MGRVIMIIGCVVAACGIIVAFKNGREKPNGILEWVLLLTGILLFVLGLNI